VSVLTDNGIHRVLCGGVRTKRVGCRHQTIPEVGPELRQLTLDVIRWECRPYPTIQPPPLGYFLKPPSGGILLLPFFRFQYTYSVASWPTEQRKTYWGWGWTELGNRGPHCKRWTKSVEVGVGSPPPWAFDLSILLKISITTLHQCRVSESEMRTRNDTSLAKCPLPLFWNTNHSSMIG